MLLVLTRPAFWRRSTLGRRRGEAAGEGERSGVFSLSKRVGESSSRVDQKSRGEGLWKEDGDEFSLPGEVSCPRISFWGSSQWQRLCMRQ